MSEWENPRASSENNKKKFLVGSEKLGMVR